MRLTHRAIFFFILLLAAILRFWEYGDIPYTHDEFSALFRTDFTSFSDLLEYGVRPDGHPAGIQVFLYYWVQWFGAEEWVVKLPFTLMGLGSLVLVYHTAKCWFTDTSALLTMAVMAVCQYHVMYSVIARPYISGLFFTSALVYCWTLLVQRPQYRFWQVGLGFVIFATLSAYNHHFSLLFATLVGVSGLFFVRRAYLWRYVALGVLAVVLYVPHLQIFFYQLQHKGVGGWLAKPGDDWLWVYVRYIFHYDYVFLGLVLGVILSGYVFWRNRSFPIHYILLSFLWFILPFAIGFFYSREVSAVLQYSVLLFSFPYLLFLIFGHFRELKVGTNIVLVLLFLSVGSFTLVHDRDHYAVTYKSHYEHIVKDMGRARVHKASTFLIASHKKITGYYVKKLGVNTDFQWADSLGDYDDFRAYIQQLNKTENHLYYGAWSSADPNYVAIIREYFPEVSWRSDYVGGSTFVFSHTKRTEDHYLTRLDFVNEGKEGWEGIAETQLMHTERSAYLLDSTTEWSPAYTCSISDRCATPNDLVQIAVNIKPIKGVMDVSIVSVIEQNGKVLQWLNTPITHWVDTAAVRWQSAYHTVDLAAITQENELVLKTYIWNKGKGTLQIDDYEVCLFPGNPLLTAWRDKYTR